VVKEYGDYGLLATSFVTGMVDGASFLNWGVFVGMQTGKLLCLEIVWETLYGYIHVYIRIDVAYETSLVLLHDPY
jgi:hypothetical protein